MGNLQYRLRAKAMPEAARRKPRRIASATGKNPRFAEKSHDPGLDRHNPHTNPRPEPGTAIALEKAEGRRQKAEGRRQK